MSMREASRTFTVLGTWAAVAAFAVLVVMVTVPWPVGAGHMTYTPEFTEDQKLELLWLTIGNSYVRHSSHNGFRGHRG